MRRGPLQAAPSTPRSAEQKPGDCLIWGAPGGVPREELPGGWGGGPREPLQSAGEPVLVHNSEHLDVRLVRGPKP